LSEATAILESAIRTLYVTIEPGKNDVSSNELLAYADLRSLRLYAGALEVAGWSLDQAVTDYNRYESSGAYRGGRGRVTDAQAQIALERFRASRETVRTLLQRVRTTAVLAEHQISFCDPVVGQQWRKEVVPALRDTINATDPLFAEEVAYQRYGVPGQQAKVIPAGGAGIPNEAVEVGRYPQYQPYDGQGQGRGRYFEIRAFGGDIRVKAIRYRNHENAFGVLGTSGVRELPIDQVVEPGAPLFIPCNRRRWVDISDLEIEWEPAQRGRKPYGLIELVESSPDDRN
ncbi:MAG TPA: hypothetical protein VL475_16470, partial [Planctomycetaceae bacterium]|nr:hypothetical protein [Planctomycetaceae bacterium]